VTYEYLMSGMKAGFPSKPVFKCPIHGHVIFEDGSLIRGDGTIQRGKVLR
jgi:hypothetical protein